MSRSRALLALAVLAGASLSGCSPYKTSIRHDGLHPTTQFTWRDGRPADQKDSGPESYLISSCAYGAYRIGDDKFDPDRVAVLRSDLERALGAQLAGKKVVLKNYTVHLNQAAGLRKGLSYTNTGLIADLLNDQSVHGCGPDDLEGSFVGNEVTTEYHPLIVVIDLEVDGKKVHARHVESAPENMDGKWRDDASPAWHDWVSKALRATTAKAIEGVKAALGTPGAA